jgi:hypothetical protein
MHHGQLPPAKRSEHLPDGSPWRALRSWLHENPSQRHCPPRSRPERARIPKEPIMNFYPRPIPSPKPARESRSQALFSGELHDLADLDVPLAGSAAALPWAISERLLQQVEEVPFGAAGTDPARQRLLRLGARAADALERARDHYGSHFGGALGHGFILDFPVELPCRMTDPHYRFVRLHCGPDEDGEIAATLGRVDEL